MIIAYGQESTFRVSSVILVPKLHYQGNKRQEQKEEPKKAASFQDILNKATGAGEEINDCVTRGYTRYGGSCEFLYVKREYRR
ncbi:MAG: hypothetical protein GX234_04570 [Clostridiales bacterium]|nr:hypothetical protein [Clostridiales bacterium]